MREQQNQAAYTTLTPYCQSDHLPAFQYTCNLVIFVYSTDTTMLYSLLYSTDDTMLVSTKGAAFSEGAWVTPMQLLYGITFILCFNFFCVSAKL